MGLIRYLPYDKYTINSLYSQNEVLAKLADNIQPKKPCSFLFYREGEKIFAGKMYGNQFKIRRIITYKNAFLPVIIGEICPNYNGQTEIFVTARLKIPIIIFMSVWLGVVGIFCLGILYASIVNLSETLKHGFSLILLVPFGMFAFVSALTLRGFRTENKKAKEELCTVLNGTISY